MPDPIEKRRKNCTQCENIQEDYKELKEDFYPWKELIIATCTELKTTLKLNCAKLKSITDNGIINKKECAKTHLGFSNSISSINGGLRVVWLAFGTVITISFIFGGFVYNASADADDNAHKAINAVELIKKDVQSINEHIEEINERDKTQALEIKSIVTEQNRMFEVIMTKLNQL